jgi:hypothetical protein
MAQVQCTGCTEYLNQVRINSILLFHVPGQEEEAAACSLLVFMWLCGVGSTKESILLLLLLSQIFLEPIPSFQDKGGICRACMSMPSFFPRLGLGCSCSYCPLYVVHAFIALHSYEIQPPNPWFPLIFVFVFATLCRKQERILCFLLSRSVVLLIFSGPIYLFGERQLVCYYAYPCHVPCPLVHAFEFFHQKRGNGPNLWDLCFVQYSDDLYNYLVLSIVNLTNTDSSLHFHNTNVALRISQF